MPLLAPLVLALGLSVLCGVPASPPGTPGSATGTWPLGPGHEVVRGFDPPAEPWEAGHRGVDLLGSAGQEVRAALAGTVTFAGRLAGRGVVVVDHGGRRTTYEPVDAAVAVGTSVDAGEVIGHLESGVVSHCFPLTCLHWGLIRSDLVGDTYLDPLTLVGGGPVRLKPLAGLLDPSGPTDGNRGARSVLPMPVQPVARPVPAPLTPLALVLRPAGGPGGTPREAARW